MCFMDIDQTTKPISHIKPDERVLLTPLNRSSTYLNSQKQNKKQH